MAEVEESHSHWNYLVNESNTFGEDDPDSSEYTWEFESKDNKIFSHARKNKEVLESYLSLFNNIYDYCEKIYKMDETIVNRFLESGEKEDFKTGGDVVEYMQLAEDYWKNKQNFIFHN